MLLPNTTTYTEFRQNLSDHLKRLKRADRPTVVLQSGRRAAVVVHPDRWEERESDAELGRLIRSIDDADRGETVDAVRAVRALVKRYESMEKKQPSGARRRRKG